MIQTVIRIKECCNLSYNNKKIIKILLDKLPKYLFAS